MTGLCNNPISEVQKSQTTSIQGPLNLQLGPNCSKLTILINETEPKIWTGTGFGSKLRIL